MIDNYDNLQLKLEEIKTLIENKNNYQEIINLLIRIQQQQEVIIGALKTNNKDTIIIKEDKKIIAKDTINIEYNKLENLLKAKQWKKADQETTNILLNLFNKQKQKYLQELDINNLPCIDLRIIDKLWQDHSNNKFGLTIQKNIYQNLGGNRFFNQKLWQEFGHKVGWYKNNNWLKYEQLNFSENAPQGHLPILGDSQIWFVGGWEGSFKAFSLFLEKLVNCNF